MAAGASGNPQQQGLYEQHLANLVRPLGPVQSIGTTAGSSPQAGAPAYSTNNWYTATGVATIKKPDGTEVPNPFDLTAEEVYFALSGHPNAIQRLKESLAARGKDDLFHNIVNYYEPGGGAYNGGGYTSQDSFNAQKNYSLGLGETTFTPMNWQAGMPVYGSMADAAAGNLAGYATGQGTGYSATGAPSTGGGGTAPGTGTTPTTTGTGTTTPGTTTPGGGSTQYGNSGDTGNFPMASAAAWQRPEYAPYTAPTRSADIGKPFDFFNDEGYKFRLDEGIKGIENSAAARGNLNSGNTLKSLSKFASGLAAQEYGDAYNRFTGNRQFLENQFTGDRAFDRDTYTGDRSFNYSTAVDERNYNNANRQWDTSFNNANRIDARNFDYGVYTGDRDFNEGLRRWDLGFNYNAANNDRTFDAGVLNSLAGMGLSGSNASATLAAALAQILSNNTMTGAGANANATVGQANNTNALISQILAMLNGNSIVNNVTGSKP